MKYSIKQDIVDTRGNRGTIVNVSNDTSAIYYQVLFDKDWATGKAEYISEENLHDANSEKWRKNIAVIKTLAELSEVTKILR
tara:strand:+ start:685 stop:930 length:246 start_codon:yes stop_codon:yes gene_type:complete